VGLDQVNLLQHNLANSIHLESVPFTNEAGLEVARVSIIKDGETVIDNELIVNDAWAIELYYFTFTEGSAIEAVAWSAEMDITMGLFEDASLIYNPIQCTPDHTQAYLAMLAEWSGVQVVYMYLAQSIPNTPYVMILDIVLIPHLWENEDNAVLAELSNQIGLDLSVYLP
jgi:hypothetical protein